MNANAMSHSPMMILTAVVMTAILSVPGSAAPAVETTESLTSRMMAHEAASPAERDGELFLIDGRVWVRNRGEREFRQVEFENPADVAAGRSVELARSCGPTEESLSPSVPENCPVVLDGQHVDGIAQACPIRFEDSAEDGAAPADQAAVDSVPDDQVILHEHFESSVLNGNWLIGDDTTNVARNYWGRVSCKSHYGSWSLWCAGDAMPVTYAPFPCSDFPADMRAYMLSAEPINVSQYTDLELSFWLWHDTWSSDPLFIWVSPGNSQWVLLDVYWGTLAQWQEKSYLIEGFETLEIQILFEADMANTGQTGAFLDDLLVSGCPALGQASPTFPAPAEVVCSGEGEWYCWDEVPGASSYTVQWGVEPSFTGPHEEAIAIGTCYHRALNGEGARWWRVSANSSCSNGQWSAPRFVTVATVPEAPNLLAPNQGAWLCNDAFVRYEWEHTAASYTVQWDDSSSFSSPVAEQTVTNPWAWQLLSGTGIRFWRVRPENGSCESEWSSIRQVTTQPCGSIFTNGFESGGTSAWSDATP